MHRLGLTQATEENFFTSAQAMLRLLKEKHDNDLIYLQDTKSLVEEYKASDLHITTDYTDNAGVDTVCVLSGEVTLEEVRQAHGVEKPTFVFQHVKEFLEL